MTTQLSLAHREIRNPNCTMCKLHTSTDKVCGLGRGPLDADIMVVSRMANSADWQHELELDLEEAGFNSTKNIYYTAAVKCRTFDQSASNADVKKCRTYLDQEIALVKPKFILGLGNEALLALTGRSGITKYRGRPFEYEGYTVFATISPSSVKRNPGQRGAYLADMRLFLNRVLGRDTVVKPPKYTIIDTEDKLKLLKRVLKQTIEIDFDVETHGDYFRADGRLISLAGTCIVKSKSGPKTWVFALPLYHPESPWRRKHRSVIAFIGPELAKIPKVVAHNASYDIKWMRQYGVDMMATFDTMLAIHTLNENVQKGLKPQAQMRLGVEPWGVDTKSLLEMPLDEVLHYNVLDTWYMYLVRQQLKGELAENPRSARLLAKLMMPAQQELVRSEMRGIWLDVQRLTDRKPQVEAELHRIEQAIAEAADLYTENNTFGLKPGDPDWPTDAKGKPREINFNASIFARWMLFDWCGLPVLERGKDKADGRPGDPSMAEGVLMALKTQHPVVPLMLERVKWQKWLSSFFNPYVELYDEDHRIHTNFKLAGTVTGRLSSGKDDPDKVSYQRGKIRGVNLQQVPREAMVRGLFGAPPGWTFAEADYSQIELRIAAMIARESHMLHLYSIGADIHRTTAARVTGLPESQVTSEIRKKVGKPVNFGFLYGMSWRKFIITAFENYGSVFSEFDAQGARAAYFKLFPGLLVWHARQRRLVNANGRVQSPLGRVRHLPDIYSPEQGVRAEAERQAINSPVQGFASDMTVLSMVAINQKLRERGLAANCLGLVHDAINFEIRDDHVAEVLPIIKDTMEDMSLVRRKFGVHVDVPIIADLKVGQHWGDSAELTPDMVYDYKPEYKGN